ncbi:MAG: YidB family protein [Pseudomonadota bacterium]
MGLLDQLGGALGGQGEDGLNAVLGALGGDNGGGLGGLIGKAQEMGLGEVVQSWVGKGENLGITPEQIQGVLGSGVIGEFAQKMGVDPAQASAQLAALLPQVIDQLTPDGKAPEGGLGGLLGGALGGGLGDMLGGLLKR